VIQEFQAAFLFKPSQHVPDFTMTNQALHALNQDAGSLMSSQRYLLGGLLIAAAVLSFLPIAILGPAIGWPASLRAPAAQQLAAIAGAPAAVVLGYSVYLLYSVLVLPVMVLLAWRVCGNLARPIAVMVVAFAALSVLARSIGILRWLTAMPAMAQQHAAADPAGKQMLEAIFTTVTTYGGGIGELLGVSLFMALSLGLAMVAAWRDHTLPRWLAALGMVSALLLFALFLPTLGIAIHVPIALAVTALTIWMLAAGLAVCFKPAKS
jgi:Domain of unknown function (DUF4386)